MEQKGSARASGKETFTDVHRTAGGGVSATSFASSTGQGAPQQHEATTLHSTPDFEHMGTHDLKVWLQARGADLRGAIERSDLIDIAKKLPPEGGSQGGGAAAQ